METVVVYILLVAPGDPSWVAWLPNHMPTLPAALQRVAVELELQDQRWAGDTSAANFHHYLRQYRHDLRHYGHLPYLRDFPSAVLDAGYASDQWHFARHHVVWVEGRVAMYPLRHDYADWLEDARRHERVWYLLDDTSRPCPPTTRRAALAELVQILGEKDVRLGIFPPPVPLGYFRRLR